jgi:hypothetical protein
LATGGDKLLGWEKKLTGDLVAAALLMLIGRSNAAHVVPCWCLAPNTIGTQLLRDPYPDLLFQELCRSALSDAGNHVYSNPNQYHPPPFHAMWCTSVACKHPLTVSVADVAEPHCALLKALVCTAEGLAVYC